MRLFKRQTTEYIGCLRDECADIFISFVCASTFEENMMSLLEGFNRKTLISLPFWLSKREYHFLLREKERGWIDDRGTHDDEVRSKFLRERDIDIEIITSFTEKYLVRGHCMRMNPH